LNFVPSAVAIKYNAEFVPPATKNQEAGGLYTTLCSARVPSFQVQIGGKSFRIDPTDQLLPAGLNNKQGEELCLSGTQDGDEVLGGEVYIL
jgi:hypothetical protein